MRRTPHAGRQRSLRGVLALLLGALLVGAGPADRRITIDVKNADIHNVLRLFAHVGQVNIVVSDRVTGRVTVRLQEVPWGEALKAVLMSRGLGAEKVGDILQVDTV